MTLIRTLKGSMIRKA